MAPNREAILKKKREAERLRREEIRNNPVLREYQKAKEREKYKRKLEKKQVKLVADMTERERKLKRQEWRKCSKRLYHKKKSEKEDISSLSNSLTASCSVSLQQKKRKQNQSNFVKENVKLKKKIVNLERIVNTLRKRERRQPAAAKE